MLRNGRNTHHRRRGWVWFIEKKDSQELFVSAQNINSDAKVAWWRHLLPQDRDMSALTTENSHALSQSKAKKPKDRDKERDRKEKMQSPGERLKIVVRRLPSNLPEDIFWHSVSNWVTDNSVSWKAYYPGKPKKRCALSWRGKVGADNLQSEQRKYSLACIYCLQNTSPSGGVWSWIRWS